VVTDTQPSLVKNKDNFKVEDLSSNSGIKELLAVQNNWFIGNKI
jgi:hypothetical protein